MEGNKIQDDSIFKNYEKKIKPKLENNFVTGNFNNIPEASDFNSLINMLNWCFIHKNNFFIENFNRKFIKDICLTYNQFKTNVLSRDEENLFAKISTQNLKLLKHIMYQYINVFDTIENTEENTILCERVSKQSIKNCVHYLNDYIQVVSK